MRRMSLYTWLRLLRKLEGTEQQVAAQAAADWLEENGDERGEALLWMVSSNLKPHVSPISREGHVLHPKCGRSFDWKVSEDYGGKPSVPPPEVYRALSKLVGSVWTYVEHGSRLSAEVHLLDAYVAARRGGWSPWGEMKGEAAI